MKIVLLWVIEFCVEVGIVCMSRMDLIKIGKNGRVVIFCLVGGFFLSIMCFVFFGLCKYVLGRCRVGL